MKFIGKLLKTLVLTTLALFAGTFILHVQSGKQADL